MQFSWLCLSHAGNALHPGLLPKSSGVAYLIVLGPICALYVVEDCFFIGIPEGATCTRLSTRETSAFRLSSANKTDKHEEMLKKVACCC